MIAGETRMFRQIKSWQIRRRIARDVHRLGWATAAGFIPPIADFSYSVGFWKTANTPDLIVSGMAPEHAHNLFGCALEDIINGRLVPADGVSWRPEEAVHAIFRDVHPTQLRKAFLVAALNYARDQGQPPGQFRALQIVFPDRRGVFPWDAEFDQTYRPYQAALWEPCPEDAPDDWSLATRIVPAVEQA